MASEVQLEIDLVPAPDDPSLHSPEYQEGLDGFACALRQQGLNPSSMVELVEVHAAAAPYLGKFSVFLKDGLSIAVPVIVAWLHGRHGRKVKLKVGDTEVEAGTSDEVEKLLARAQDFKLANEPRRIHER